jgi:hypothetical protein
LGSCSLHTRRGPVGQAAKGLSRAPFSYVSLPTWSDALSRCQPGPSCQPALHFLPCHDQAGLCPNEMAATSRASWDLLPAVHAERPYKEPRPHPHPYFASTRRPKP